MSVPNLQISNNKFYALIVLQETKFGRDDILSTGSHHVNIKNEDIQSIDKNKRTFCAIPTKMDGVGDSYIRCLAIERIKKEELGLILNPNTRNDFANIHIWICQIPENATFYQEGKHIYSNVIVFQNEIQSIEELEFLQRKNKEIRTKYDSTHLIAEIREEASSTYNKTLQNKETDHMNLLALDFETSQAFGLKRACQIGLTPIINGKIEETQSFLIRPPKNMYDKYTIKKHHITPEMTESSPSFGELWPSIKFYFDNADALIAHEVSTERNVLINEFQDYKLGTMSYKFIDTLELYRQKYNQGEINYRLGLEYICRAFGINTDNHHDAGDDSRNCAIIYLNYINGIDPDINLLAEHTYENNNNGQFKSKEELGLSDFIDINSIEPIENSILSHKRIIVTREFTIFGHESKNSEDIVRDYLHIKFNANTKKGDVNGTTDYVFVGANKLEDWNKGKLKKVKEFVAKGTLKGIFYQEDIDKLFAKEHRV